MYWSGRQRLQENKRRHRKGGADVVLTHTSATGELKAISQSASRPLNASVAATIAAAFAALWYTGCSIRFA